MSKTQGAPNDPTGELIALLVPPRQSRARTVLVGALVVATLGAFALVRTSGLVVPHLHVQLQSSSVAPDGSVSAVVRIFNDGRLATRVDGLGAEQLGLSRAQVRTPLPVTIAGRSHRDVAIRWRAHDCRAITHGEAARFSVHARSGLPFSFDRTYPIRRSDTFVAHIEPAPPAAPVGDLSTSGGYGGWVMQVLEFACTYGR